MFKQFTGEDPKTHHEYKQDKKLFERHTEQFVRSRLLLNLTTSEYIKNFSKLNQ